MCDSDQLENEILESIYGDLAFDDFEIFPSASFCPGEHCHENALQRHFSGKLRDPTKNTTGEYSEKQVQRVCNVQIMR